MSLENAIEVVAEVSAPEKLDPISVEQKLTEHAEQNAQDPQEIAAQMYTLYWPRLSGMFDAMSKKQLNRVVKALFEVPLLTDKPNLPSEMERIAFNIGDRLNQAKMSLIISTLFSDKVLDQVSIEETNVPSTESSLEESKEVTQNDEKVKEEVNG